MPSQVETSTGWDIAVRRMIFITCSTKGARKGRPRGPPARTGTCGPVGHGPCGTHPGSHTTGEGCESDGDHGDCGTSPAHRRRRDTRTLRPRLALPGPVEGLP